MRIGDKDGKYDVYNEYNRLILVPDEKVFLTFLPNIYDICIVPYESFQHSEELVRMCISIQYYTKDKEINNWEPIATSMVDDDYNLIEDWALHGIPSTFYVSNKRLVSLRPGFPTKKFLFVRGYSPGPGDRVIRYEAEIFNTNSMLYSEIYWSDMNRAEVSDSCVYLVLNKGIKLSINFDTHIKMGLFSARRHPSVNTTLHKTSAIMLGIRKAVQIFQMKNFLGVLNGMEIPIHYTRRGTKRWLEFIKIFEFGDADGLGKIYNSEGKPILQKDEHVNFNRTVLPIITWPRRIRLFFVKKYGIIRPQPTEMFVTNKRLILLRKIHEDDVHYREFEPIHRIYFALSMDKVRKLKTRRGELYRAKLDKRNWVEILLPSDKQNALRKYRKHQYKIEHWADKVRRALEEKRARGEMFEI